MTKAEILEKQRQLQIQFKAWMDDKKKREVLTFMRPNSNIVRHYPDDTKKLLNMQNNLSIFYCGTNGAGKTTLRGFNKDTVQIVIDWCKKLPNELLNLGFSIT